MANKIIRCAVYTRKSSEEGLEQDFNSLDAQREAGEAFIKSQKHEGWELIPDRYDDPAFSGGNMERPALKKLLADINAGKINVVVVYKVDRLSRALSDFARIVEIFDKHGVSFVSVTQQFNTTSSMGRLTLNVLLSFAQFEREVTGERIRDKFAASKQKGIWMGGPLPLGYVVKDRKLYIEPEGAEIVRYIFQKYSEFSEKESFRKLLEHLKQKGYKNKARISRAGNTIGGKDFDLNKMYTILRNPLYLGKIKHRDKIYDGQHEAIISQEIWDKVQLKFSRSIKGLNPKSYSERPKLLGKVYDYHGNKFSSSYSYKYSKGGRYKMRYYMNRQLSRYGSTDSEFKRLRVDHIDDTVMNIITAVHKKIISHLSKSNESEVIADTLKSLQQINDDLKGFLERVTLYPKHLELILSIKNPDPEKSYNTDNIISVIRKVFSKPISYRNSALNEKEAIENIEISSSDKNLFTLKFNVPIRYRRNGGKLYIITQDKDYINVNDMVEKKFTYPETKIFSLIAKAFYWSKLIRDGNVNSATELADNLGISGSYLNHVLKLRHLSPHIIDKFLNNDLGKDLNMTAKEAVRDFNWKWQEQEKVFL